MTMQDLFLSKNPFSRPGKIRVKTQAIVIHWTANPKQDWHGVWQYFEDRKNGKNEYGSAQYVIGLKGEIIRMMPDDEVSYHCGTSQVDPASGKIYTDLARMKFGKYATDYQTLSPNFVTTGIEHCVIGPDGSMNDATIDSSLNLVARLCHLYNLDPEKDILLHKDVVGWKDCHMWWVTYRDAWDNYKLMVKQRMETI
jgi:N-acetylmuramoyl-L-alanine amidase